MLTRHYDPHNNNNICKMSTRHEACLKPAHTFDHISVILDASDGCHLAAFDFGGTGTTRMFDIKGKRDKPRTPSPLDGISKVEK
jgi:hypothetical protein